MTYDNPKNGPDGQPLKDDKGNPVTEKATATEQTIPLGPAASQIAIKQLGTNGGGFFNVNSAHPFENPTPLSNFLEMLAILLIPAALCYTFGKMIRDTRQGWAMLAAMTLVFVALLAADYALEAPGNPVLAALGVDQAASATNPGGNMEGKEVRFGVANSTLWAVATTSASNGSVNSMHDSFMPLAGHDPDVADSAGRGHLRRRGFRALRNDHVRAHRRLHRRPDDRPHAGVSRQEDRRVRDQDGVDRDPAAAAAGAVRRGRRRDDRRGQGRRRESRPSTASRKSSTRSPPPATTTAVRSPACPPTRRSTTPRSASACCSPATGWRSRCWRLPAHSPPRSSFRRPAGTLPTHTPLFVFVLIGTVITVGALTFVPALALGPVVEHLLLYAGH